MGQVWLSCVSAETAKPRQAPLCSASTRVACFRFAPPATPRLVRPRLAESRCASSASPGPAASCRGFAQVGRRCAALRRFRFAQQRFGLPRLATPGFARLRRLCQAQLRQATLSASPPGYAKPSSAPPSRLCLATPGFVLPGSVEPCRAAPSCALPVALREVSYGQGLLSQGRFGCVASVLPRLVWPGRGGMGQASPCPVTPAESSLEFVAPSHAWFCRVSPAELVPGCL